MTIDETDEALEKVCGSFIELLFELWHIFDPTFEKLEKAEKELVDAPLARVFKKYSLDRFVKDEIMVGSMLGLFVLRRLKSKKHDSDRSRETGQGKDDTHKESDKTK